MFMRRPVRLYLCLTVTAITCLAQTDRGIIRGTVIDSTGAVIAGANVRARNIATNTEFATVSTGTGDYTIPNL